MIQILKPSHVGQNQVQNPLNNPQALLQSNFLFFELRREKTGIINVVMEIIRLPMNFPSYVILLFYAS
jgi:hypothetical protein